MNLGRFLVQKIFRPDFLKFTYLVFIDVQTYLAKFTTLQQVGDRFVTRQMIE
jgi:hypothetical protein